MGLWPDRKVEKVEYELTAVTRGVQLTLYREGRFLGLASAGTTAAALAQARWVLSGLRLRKLYRIPSSADVMRGAYLVEVLGAR